MISSVILPVILSVIPKSDRLTDEITDRIMDRITGKHEINLPFPRAVLASKHHLITVDFYR